MNNAATEAALAALRYWTAQAGAGKVDAPESELVRQAAWLVKGQAATGDGLPSLDLSEPLRSIFSRIAPKAEGQKPTEIYIRRASLALNAHALFPTERTKAAETSGGHPIESR